MPPSFLNTASATSTIFDSRRLKFYWIDASNSKICSKKIKIKIQNECHESLKCKL